MPRRKIVFANEYTYHIHNRSIAKTDIFSSLRNLKKALEIVNFYRFPQQMRLSKFNSLGAEIRTAYLESISKTTPLVDIYAFSFMPNHYHFLIKQLTDKGIINFISNFQNSFAKVFNLKTERTGSLFQSQFKGKRPETDEEFLHISRYIHLNHVSSCLLEFDKLKDCPWTSFGSYAQALVTPFVQTEPLIELAGSTQAYLKFVADQADYQRSLELIKNLTIE